MKRSLPAFGVPLLLAAAVVQSEGRFPQAAPLIPNAGPAYSLPPLPALKALTPTSPYRYGPGDTIPRAYMVFGLQTSPGGMAFTDENGHALMSAHPQIITGPFVSTPQLVLPIPPTPQPPKK